METQVVEYKSLQKIQTGDKGFKELAKTCVCLANSQGGTIIIGYDDKTKEPPINQKIAQKQINDTLERIKGKEFLINPDIIKTSKLNLKTNLKTIEPHRLLALLETDIFTYPNSSIRDIQKRLPDVDIKDIRKTVYQMVNDEKLIPNGSLKNRTYKLA